MSDSEVASRVVALFEAWSSNDPGRVGQLFHPDATLFDSVNGQFQGRAAIEDFHARSLETWEDLTMSATRIWVDGDTAACTWTMSARMKNDRSGEGLAGTSVRIDGMAWLRFEGRLVIHDEEYFDRQAALASLDGRGFVTPRST